jgi:hypothetical protein
MLHANVMWLPSVGEFMPIRYGDTNAVVHRVHRNAANCIKHSESPSGKQGVMGVLFGKYKQNGSTDPIGGQMKRKEFLLLAGYALAVTGLIAAPVSSSADQGKTEQELTRVERNWCNADVKNDDAALSAILADDFTDVNLNGKVTNKAQSIADLKTDKTTACDVDMLHFQIYGDTAIVVGRATVKSATYNGQYMYTDVYVRRNGQWQAVAAQGTEIKK